MSSGKRPQCLVVSIYSSRYANFPLFEHLTPLKIFESIEEEEEFKDPRVISYVLAHSRRLKKLEIELKLFLSNLKIDDAFTGQLICAPLEQLKIFCSSEMTDVTIDVLCQQLASVKTRV